MSCISNYVDVDIKKKKKKLKGDTFIPNSQVEKGDNFKWQALSELKRAQIIDEHYISIKCVLKGKAQC